MARKLDLLTTRHPSTERMNFKLYLRTSFDEASCRFVRHALPENYLPEAVRVTDDYQGKNLYKANIICISHYPFVSQCQ